MNVKWYYRLPVKLVALLLLLVLLTGAAIGLVGVVLCGDAGIYESMEQLVTGWDMRGEVYANSRLAWQTCERYYAWEVQSYLELASGRRTSHLQIDTRRWADEQREKFAPENTNLRVMLENPRNGQAIPFSDLLELDGEYTVGEDFQNICTESFDVSPELGSPLGDFLMVYDNGYAVNPAETDWSAEEYVDGDGAYETEEPASYTVTAYFYLDPSLPVRDDFAKSYDLYVVLCDIAMPSLLMMGGGTVLALIFWVYLMCAAGHRAASDKDVITLRFIDRIPYDLFWILIGGAFGLLILLASIVFRSADLYQLVYRPNRMSTAILISALFGCAVLFAAATLSTAARWKSHTLLRNTIVWRICAGIWHTFSRGAGKVGERFQPKPLSPEEQEQKRVQRAEMVDKLRTGTRSLKGFAFFILAFNLVCLGLTGFGGVFYLAVLLAMDILLFLCCMKSLDQHDEEAVLRLGLPIFYGAVFNALVITLVYLTDIVPLLFFLAVFDIFIFLIYAHRNRDEIGLAQWLSEAGSLLGKLRNGISNAFGILPTVWKGVLVPLAVALVNLLLVLLSIDSGGSAPFFLLFLLVVFDLVVVWKYLEMLRQIVWLHEGAKRIAAGDLEYRVPVEAMKWEFKAHGEALNTIRSGIDAAVEERVKAVQARTNSDRMRSELLTNVSHDIKTPLTSIINYIDLLKKEHVKGEKAEEYIGVLDRQAVKLKKLLEDLIEASKASTGNIAVNAAPTNVGELLRQVTGEYAEKLLQAQLEPIITLPGKEAVIFADGRLLWRIFDNLMGNIVKYAMPQTRVYLDLRSDSELTVIAVKNISRERLNIAADELMERFVRGDSSRATEGSGLGLSIAQSLTELMGGTFELMIDGDLFKIKLSFPTMKDAPSVVHKPDPDPGVTFTPVLPAPAFAPDAVSAEHVPASGEAADGTAIPTALEPVPEEALSEVPAHTGEAAADAAEKVSTPDSKEATEEAVEIQPAEEVPSIPEAPEQPKPITESTATE